MKLTTTALANAGDDRLYTTKDAARYLQASHRTMEDWRLKGRGPRFSYAGKRVVYRRSELDAYLAARTFGNTKEAKAALTPEKFTKGIVPDLGGEHAAVL